MRVGLRLYIYLLVGILFLGLIPKYQEEASKAFAMATGGGLYLLLERINTTKSPEGGVY